MKHKALYRITEVAELIGVGRVTVWRWCKDGKMQHVILPSGQIRITADEVNRFINAGITVDVGAMLNDDKSITITQANTQTSIVIQLYDVDALCHRLLELKSQAEES
jgi:excisionase family DNA binding protein